MYTSVQLRDGSLAILWLVADDPEGPKRHVERSMALWPSNQYLLQHWHRLYGEGEIELYVGDGARAYARVDRDTRAFRAGGGYGGLCRGRTLPAWFVARGAGRRRSGGGRRGVHEGARRSCLAASSRRWCRDAGTRCSGSHCRSRWTRESKAGSSGPPRSSVTDSEFLRGTAPSRARPTGPLARVGSVCTGTVPPAQTGPNLPNK
jgi:hypothetical protein